MKKDKNEEEVTPEVAIEEEAPMRRGPDEEPVGKMSGGGLGGATLPEAAEESRGS